MLAVPRKRRLRTAAVWMAVVVLPAAIVLVVLDVALGIFDPIGLRHFAEAKRYADEMQPNDVYAYIHRPGLRGRFQGVDVAINAAGFRGPDIDATAPEGRLRVLVLGDSMVFGWGAPQDAIFPIRLQGMLERVFPAVEVIPAGVGSWNTRSEYEYLRTVGVELRPRVIVLLITANDLDPHRGGRTEVARSRLFPAETGRAANPRPLTPPLYRSLWYPVSSRSYLMELVRYVRTVRSIRESQRTVDAAQWEDARLALDGITRLARETGAALITFLYPAAAEIEQSAVLRAYRDHLRASDVPCVALPSELVLNARLRVSIVDGHPNADGHAIIARHIYEQLVPVLKAL